MSEELLTVQEVAEYLKVNEQTVRNWIDRSEITAVRAGARRVRIRRSDLDTFLEQRETGRAPEPSPPSDALPKATEAFRASMRDATEKLDAAPGDLAAALISLADAAKVLADALMSEQEPLPPTGA